MSYRELINDIKKNSVKNINILYGSEVYLLDKAFDNLKEHIVTAYPELNYTMLDGEHIKPGQLESACETFPFACERRMVAIRNLYALQASSKRDNENTGTSEEIKELINIISNISDTTCLVFINDDNIDKRKKIFTEIKKNGSVYEFGKVDRDDFGTWIKNVLSKDDKKIGPKEMNYFMNVSGYMDKNSSKTLYNVENDLKKLVNFMGNTIMVSTEHIDSIMPRNMEHDIFKLINACSEKNVSDSLKIYSDQLLDGESSFGILAMLSKQVKNILGVQELSKNGYDTRSISDKLRIHEYTVKLCTKYCGAINRSKLVNALNRCMEAEINIKSGKMSERLAMEMLLVNLFE